MPSKGASTLIKPARIPSLTNLRVKHPDKNSQNPCVAIMSNMLNCWASAGASMEGCQALEGQLRICMDDKNNQVIKKNNINYHLMRLYPKVAPPKKKEGVGRRR